MRGVVNSGGIVPRAHQGGASYRGPASVCGVKEGSGAVPSALIPRRGRNPLPWENRSCLRPQDRNSSRRLQGKCPRAGKSARPLPFVMSRAWHCHRMQIEGCARRLLPHRKAARTGDTVRLECLNPFQGDGQTRCADHSRARATSRVVAGFKRLPTRYRRTRSVDGRKASRGTRAGSRERRADRAIEGRGPRFAKPSRLQQWGQFSRSSPSTYA